MVRLTHMDYGQMVTNKFMAAYGLKDVWVSGHRKNQFGTHGNWWGALISRRFVSIVTVFVTVFGMMGVVMASSSAAAQTAESAKNQRVGAEQQGLKSTPENFVPTTPRRRPPNLTFAVEQNGKTTQASLASYAGKVVVLNFWATWCGPCVREMPSLDRLQADQSARGIEVVPVSIDRAGAPVVRRFYAARKIEHLPIIIDRDREFVRAFTITELPTTIILDPTGREVGRVMGAIEWNSPAVVALLHGFVTKNGTASLDGKKP